MSVTDTSVLQTGISDTFVDDMKDHLLQNLKVSELEDFKKEIESEILVRNYSDERYKKHKIEMEDIKKQFAKQKQEELDKYEKELEDNKAKLKKQFLKKDIEEDEDNEEEEEDDELIKPTKNNKRKYNKKKHL